MASVSENFQKNEMLEVSMNLSGGTVVKCKGNSDECQQMMVKLSEAYKEQEAKSQRTPISKIIGFTLFGATLGFLVASRCLLCVVSTLFFLGHRYHSKMWFPSKIWI